jgi:hypothetical protein
VERVVENKGVRLKVKGARLKAEDRGQRAEDGKEIYKPSTLSNYTFP